MPALRTVTAFARTPPLSLSTLYRNPTRATFPSVQSLNPHPTIPSKRSFITVVESYQRGLVFRLGQYHREKAAGLRWNFPALNEVRKVDMRTQTMQIPSQELVTKDNVTIHVDAVAFFKVDDPLKALCNIEDRNAAVSEAAQTSVRDQLSRAAFDEVLHDRDEAGRNVLAALCNLTADWGILVSAVKLKNIRVDSTMIRAMGRVAEAQRVRSARLIEASAEHDASLKLVQAGRQYADAPLSLRLREMQNHAQMAAEKNTTVMIVPATGLDSGVTRALVTLSRHFECEELRERGGGTFEEEGGKSKKRQEVVRKETGDESGGDEDYPREKPLLES